jgi:DNA modification methylase
MNIRNRVKALRNVRAGDLVPNPKNWRAHPKAQQDALRGILAEVGYADALLARELDDGRLMLVDGHLRAETTPEQEVPVLVLDLNEAEADKLLLSLDPLAALAETNAVALDALLREVDTGSEALQQMYADLADAADLYKDGEKDIVEDEVPEPPAEPITKPGDLWMLGDHRLLCGDSTDAAQVGRLMEGGQADMVLSDPPYGVSYVGKTKDALKVENDELDEAALTKLVCDAFDNAEANCRAGAYWYATVPAGPLHILFADDWKRRGILRQIMVWAKDSMVLGHSEYHYQHEPILFGWIPGDRHKNSDRTRTTLWQYDRPKANREHPTMKPVALWAQAVSDGSRAGEVVYDPFLGSGTTLIAAEQLGRKCYGMEISPAYCDVIVKRWETLTGKKAKLEVNNGQTRPATGADDHQDRQGKPGEKVAQQKRAKASR